MFTPYKDRTLKEGQKVQIYKNLHNGKYSVRDAKTGLVLGYTDRMQLNDCRFKIQKAGQRKVRETGQKNVHAFIQGYYSTCWYSLGFPTEEVVYNPYNNDTFIKKDTWETVLGSKEAYILEGGIFI